MHQSFFLRLLPPTCCIETDAAAAETVAAVVVVVVAVALSSHNSAIAPPHPHNRHRDHCAKHRRHQKRGSEVTLRPPQHSFIRRRARRRAEVRRKHVAQHTALHNCMVTRRSIRPGRNSAGSKDSPVGSDDHNAAFEAVVRVQQFEKGTEHLRSRTLPNSSGGAAAMAVNDAAVDVSAHRCCCCDNELASCDVACVRDSMSTLTSGHQKPQLTRRDRPRAHDLRWAVS